MPETTENYRRVPTGKKKKKDAKIRTIKISKSIKALYDVKNKVIVTYLFDVNEYTMKEAKKWVKDHKDSAAHAALVNLDYALYRQDESWVSIREEAMEKALDASSDILEDTQQDLFKD